MSLSVTFGNVMRILSFCVDFVLTLWECYEQDGQPPEPSLSSDLAELPLVKLDVSCNKVTSVPLCYRKMLQLQSLQLENNPLHSPPAQVGMHYCVCVYVADWRAITPKVYCRCIILRAVLCQQPYLHALCSCQIAEAKRVWAWLGLWWETTWEN